MRLPPVHLIAGGAVLAAVAYVALRGARQAGGDLGGAVIDFADGALSGAVVGIGERVGIPETNKSECQRRAEAFRALPWYEQATASFGLSAHCSAGDYFRFITTGGKGPMDP